MTNKPPKATGKAIAENELPAYGCDMTEQPIFPWTQPHGLWWERGASGCAVRLGMSIDTSLEAINSHHENKDIEGFGLWHYWAAGKQPEKTWPTLILSKAVNTRDEIAHNGHHAWHRLALLGHTRALSLWQAQWGIPDIGETKEGDSLLHCAAWSGNPDTLHFVLKIIQEAQSNEKSVKNRAGKKENGKRKNHETGKKDVSGYTPLIVSIHRGSESCPLEILKNGGDPNCGDHQGRTAMHHAALYNNQDLMTLMEQSGGDPDLSDHHGQTAHDLLRNRREQTTREREVLREHWRKRWKLKIWF